MQAAASANAPRPRDLGIKPGNRRLCLCAWRPARMLLRAVVPAGSRRWCEVRASSASVRTHAPWLACWLTISQLSAKSVVRQTVSAFYALTNRQTFTPDVRRRAVSPAGMPEPARPGGSDSRPSRPPFGWRTLRLNHKTLQLRPSVGARHEPLMASGRSPKASRQRCGHQTTCRIRSSPRSPNSSPPRSRLIQTRCQCPFASSSSPGG
jgi:hypothetical protein